MGKCGKMWENDDIQNISLRHVYKTKRKNDFRYFFFIYFFAMWKSNISAVQNRSQKWWGSSKEGSRVTFRRPTQKNTSSTVFPPNKKKKSHITPYRKMWKMTGKCGKMTILTENRVFRLYYCPWCVLIQK